MTAQNTCRFSGISTRNTGIGPIGRLVSFSR
nr:TPA_asm: m70.5 sORF 1 [Murid betaherpesvirus 1]DBA07816.1 TPA_asm: m70.5 sORF 1 [Murid betaherpesvirus 1]